MWIMVNKQKYSGGNELVGKIYKLWENESNHSIAKGPSLDRAEKQPISSKIMNPIIPGSR